MNNNAPAAAPKPHEHIVCTSFDSGEGVLVDLNSKKYFQLNETALLVWESLEQGRSHDEIVARMTEQYDVSREHAAASLERLLENLRSYKLIREG
ncbi:MAG TPA: PqqD family protein [Pyrinomonadaceae bacterium]|nr:PqqD family protein [Pyrinomonadaceae bacterium]